MIFAGNEPSFGTLDEDSKLSYRTDTGFMCIVAFGASSALKERCRRRIDPHCAWIVYENGEE